MAYLEGGSNGDGTMYAWIEYNPGNMRLTNANWVLVSGYQMHAMIWEDDILIVDYTDAQSGSVNLPGNRRAVEITDDGDPYDSVPLNIAWHLKFEHIM